MWNQWNNQGGYPPNMDPRYQQQGFGYQQPGQFQQPGMYQPYQQQYGYQQPQGQARIVNQPGAYQQQYRQPQQPYGGYQQPYPQQPYMQQQQFGYQQPPAYQPRPNVYQQSRGFGSVSVGGYQQPYQQQSTTSSGISLPTANVVVEQPSQQQESVVVKLDPAPGYEYPPLLFKGERMEIVQVNDNEFKYIINKN